MVSTIRCVSALYHHAHYQTSYPTSSTLLSPWLISLIHQPPRGRESSAHKAQAMAVLPSSCHMSDIPLNRTSVSVTYILNTESVQNHSIEKLSNFPIGHRGVLLSECRLDGGCIQIKMNGFAKPVRIHLPSYRSIERPFALRSASQVSITVSLAFSTLYR